MTWLVCFESVALAYDIQPQRTEMMHWRCGGVHVDCTKSVYPCELQYCCVSGLQLPVICQLLRRYILPLSVLAIAYVPTYD